MYYLTTLPQSVPLPELAPGLPLGSQIGLRLLLSPCLENNMSLILFILPLLYGLEIVM